MTPELLKYYEDRFSMMSMDGWKELTIDIDNISASTVDAIKAAMPQGETP